MIDIKLSVSLLASSFLWISLGCQHAPSPEITREQIPENRSMAFSWPFLSQESVQFRGGMTQGGDILLANNTDHRWLDLQEPGISDFEKDRRSILNMAGSFRVSFQFIETAGFVDNYSPPRPYFSWGTEKVQVLEDRGDFICLQHILVMFFKDSSGTIQGPMVMKHWRQDWTYQDTNLHLYEVQRKWSRKNFEESDVQGKWSQAVFQVDDSPRYEVLGRWKHENGVSFWKSDFSGRPLPRREFSVRKDYNLLEGEHQITILPTGWLHEQNNMKVNVINDQSSTQTQYLAKETGFNRYERISDPSLSAADDYWEATSDYWKDVRKAWEVVYAENDTFILSSNFEDRKLYEYHFGHAHEIEQSGTYDPDKYKKLIDQTLDNFLDKKLDKEKDSY
jgi:hypothetical protein